MSDTYSINKEIINAIFNRVVSNSAFTEKKNVSSVQSILLNNLTDSTIETIIHLMLSHTEYKVLNVGDHLKVKPPTYHVGSEYEVDILDDLGLLPKEPGYAYGIVKGDTSWSTSDPYNPFYSRIKVDLYYHCSERKLKLYEHEVNPLYCLKVNKSSIPYFKPKKKKNIDINPKT